MKSASACLIYPSGPLGVADISADTRVLLNGESARAKQALELFALRIAGKSIQWR